MSISLEGKTCIVTGSAGGLGRSVAAAFLKARANVVICDINTERLDLATNELAFHGSVLAVQTDVTSETSILKLFDSAIGKFGQVDFLINNAGIMDDFKPVGDMDKETWNQVLAVNLTAPYELSKMFINNFLSREGQKGAIVNVSSIASLSGFRAGAAYTASKHGLIGLTKNIAAFYGRKGIRCNAILPGGMATNIADTAFKMPHEEGLTIARQAWTADTGLCDLDEVANVCLFLCSEQSNVVNGVCVNVDRGWAAH